MVFSSNGSTTTAIPILNNSHFFICRENIRKAKLPPPAIFVGFQSRFRKFTLPPFKRTYSLSSPFHTSPVKKDSSTGNNWSWVSQRLTSASYSTLVLFDIFEYYEAYKTKLGISNLCLYHIHRLVVSSVFKRLSPNFNSNIKGAAMEIISNKIFFGGEGGVVIINWNESCSLNDT